MNEQTHVRVRIAVAVDRNGHWGACGREDQYGNLSEASAIETASRHVEEGERITFVEAWVPRPEIQPPEVIEGEVKD